VRQSTLGAYERLLDKIIAGLGADPKKYTAADARRFVVEYGTTHSPTATKAVVNVLRAFIRFLTAEGMCSDTLGTAIPHFRCPPTEPLPAVLSAEEVQKVLDATNPDGLVGVRDRAILLLLLRLGLRASDVAALRFSDVLWERGLLRLSGKGRRESCIPLPQEVGDALLAYVELRPKVVTEVIFLRVPAPARPFDTAHAVTAIARRALRRAGVQNPAPRRQIFRHSAATHLARARLRPESIATILRHRSLSMTAHYTHANPRTVKGVIQPWPVALPR
jgi:site-specific recombinase XerD